MLLCQSFQQVIQGFQMVTDAWFPAWRMSDFYFVINMTTHAAKILFVNPVHSPGNPICICGASFLEIEPPSLEWIVDVMVSKGLTKGPYAPQWLQPKICLMPSFIATWHECRYSFRKFKKIIFFIYFTSFSKYQLIFFDHPLLGLPNTCSVYY